MFTTTTKKNGVFLTVWAFILTIGLLGTTQASTKPEMPTEQEAKLFVEDLIKQGMEIANRPTAKQDEFGELLEKNFVTREIALFVLGADGRSFSDAQKEMFHQVYKKRLVQVYSTPERINTFKNTTHKIEGGSSPQRDGTLLIRTLFFFNNTPSAQPAKVSWKIVKKNGSLKIFDIEFEGVSQLLAHRSEYHSLFIAGDKGKSNPDSFLKYLENEVNSRKDNLS